MPPRSAVESWVSSAKASIRRTRRSSYRPITYGPTSQSTAPAMLAWLGIAHGPNSR